MFTRPKVGDTEEEILKLQEEFLSKQPVSSATVINKRKSQDNGTIGITDTTQNSSSKKLCSKFASSRITNAEPKNEKNERIAVGPDILGEIKEKITTHLFVPPPNTPSKQGFPEAFLRDKTLSAKGRSIFAQQVAKQKENEMVKEMEVETLESVQKADIMVTKLFGSRSFVVSGPEAQKIHEENIEKLSKVSADEILKEQQKIASQLDPKLLEFIRTRRHVEKVENQTVSYSSGQSVQMEVDASLGHVSGDSSSQFENKKVIQDRVDSSGHGVENVDPSSFMFESNKWLHMDILEREKMQWIGDIPPAPPPPVDKPYSARFNFQGILLPYAEDKVDVTRALHHHGEEPERPGYTLQELLQLSRSSMLQQRVLALMTLGNILDKTKAGYYDECMDTPLLNQLVDSDLYLLFRFSLDDNTETILTATLMALRNMLWNQPDELCLDRILGLWRGHFQPNLMVKTEATKSNEKEDQKAEEAELKDHQILMLDMVKGALRTDIILRLRYILEVLQPGPKAVINVLEILIRIVRHSKDSALAVTCCPRLLSVIIKNFVPRDWRGLVGTTKPSEMASVYGIPLVEALKLLRVIASSSRNMASDLVHKFGVMDSVITYISIDPRECGLPKQEAVRLSFESFYLWNTLLAYNLATTHFTDLYPVLMRLLQFHLSATSAADVSSIFGHEHGAAVMSLLMEAFVDADAQSKRVASQKVANIPERMPVTLTYEHFSGFTHLLELCLKKWLSQLTRAEEITFSALKLVTATLNCLAVQYSKSSSQPGVDSVSRLEHIEELVNLVLQPFLSSSNFRLMCGKVKSSSCLLSKKRLGTDRDPSSLPSLGALAWGGTEVVPTICPSSPIPFFQGLAHYLTTVYSLHHGLHMQCVRLFLDNPHILDYVSSIGNQTLQGENNWFTRLETCMLANMLKLLKVVLPATDFQHVSLFHNMALRLVAIISSVEKFLAKEIFYDAVFNSDFFRDCSEVAFNLEALNLSDVVSQQEQGSIHTLLERATSKIPIIWHCYESSLGLLAVSEYNSLDISSQSAGANGFEQAFPSDWTYQIILKLYRQALSGKADCDDNTLSVISSLQWLLIVECLRPQSMATISVTARFCYLSTVFLAGNDLFLEPEVHHHLDTLLRILLRNNSNLNFNEKIPGFTSFYDLYTQLVEQFAAVSYGDELFGHFVMIPLQQRHSPSYRKLVWSEQAAILRVLRTPPHQLAVPLQAYLEPYEMDPSLLMCYLNGLATGQVREIWCPVLYKVAVHHVATFISQQPNTSIAQQLSSRIQKLGNKDLRNLFSTYCSVTT